MQRGLKYGYNQEIKLQNLSISPNCNNMDRNRDIFVV